MIFKSSISVKCCLQEIHSYFQAHGLFYGHGTDNAWDEACCLLNAVLKKTDYVSESIMTDENLREISGLLRRRVEEKKPCLSHQTGLVCGLDFSSG